MSGVNDIVEIQILYTLYSQRLMTTLGFEAQTALSTPLALATGVKTNLVKATSGGIFYGRSSQLSCTTIRAVDVVPGTSATATYTFSAVTGTDSTSDALPPQVAGVCTLYTDLKGRSYRGRIYLPGAVETDQTGGTWSAAHQTNLAAIMTNLMAVYGPGGTDGDWRIGVISRFLNKAPRVTPIWTAVTATAVRSTVYTQRRRTLGVGA